MIRILIPSLILLLGWTTNASAQWYQVEMIVFEHINPGFDGEDIFRDPGLVPLNNTVHPVTPPPLPPAPPAPVVPAGQPVAEPVKPLVPYGLLPLNEYRLVDVYQTLRRSPDYRPRYHIAWQQQGYDGRSARAVHVQEDDTGSLFELTIPPALVTDPMPLEFYEPVKLLLDGTVRIRSGSLLHVDLDMVLFRSPAEGLPPNLPSTQPLPMKSNPALIERPADYVRLTETRRIRLNELVYFDHPKFGVILQVSRYEQTPEANVTTPGT